MTRTIDEVKLRQTSDRSMISIILNADKELAEAFALLKERGMTPEDYRAFLILRNIETRCVDSSNINKVSYDGNTCNMLVEFKLGSVYEYETVPRDLFEELTNADSVGSFFNINVKNNFKFRKVK